jgi:hypothetical protein
MSRQTALVHLGLAAQDWGPCYPEHFSHEQFAAGWRGSVACPTQAQINAASAAYDEAATVDARKTAQAAIALGQNAFVNTVIDALYNLDKRVRVLESQPAITKSQFINGASGLRDIYKSYL